MPENTLVLAGLEGLAIREHLSRDAENAAFAIRALADTDDAEAASSAMQKTDILVLGLPLADGMVERGFSLVNAAKAVGVRHIVFLSRYAAAHDAHWRLGRETGRIDLAVEQSGLPFTILRPNTLMSAAFTLPPDGQDTIRLPGADAAVSYLHPADLSRCILAVANAVDDHAGRTYAVTGPEALSPREAVAIMAEAAGRPLSAVDVDEGEYTAMLMGEGRSQWQVEMLISLTRIGIRGMMRNVTGAVKHLTGHEPRPFSEYARSAWG